jgi:hypothetical protein
LTACVADPIIRHLLPARKGQRSDAHPSEVWLTAVAELRGADCRYAEIARHRVGDILPLKESDPRSGADTAAVDACLDLRHGQCRRSVIHFAGEAYMPRPAITLGALRSTGLRSIEGQPDPMRP